MKLFFLTIVFYCVSLIEPHGFLTKPLPRQFIHYYRPDIPPFNGDPSALFCGTFEHQYYLNGKDFEIFFNSKIKKCYLRWKMRVMWR